MAIAPGTRLGVYEVVAKIGAGGMGEVYRAHDTRLNRNVALKVLPEAFSRDTQRMARFEREAKLLASLNHPNIAAIYGLEESGPIFALVMELVEGPTLAERIAAGAVPVDEALPIARQVADAVEYAHDKNVIHRDLKPANIKVTAEGTVKVLDFGLAKALSDEVAAEDMSNSPTLSMAATRQGVILGTAAYMSPEQAKGKVVDRRADVWAFGAVLYEMLTGKEPFQGEDVTEVLAAVVRAEPNWEELPTKTPSAIRNLLRRCLEKNLKRRLAHIAEARILIEDVLSGAAVSETPVDTQHKSRLSSVRVAWMIAVLCFVASAVTLALGLVGHFRAASENTTRLFMLPPEGRSLELIGVDNGFAAPLTVSPDGRRVAMIAAGEDGKSQLWVRSLDTLTAQVLADTEGALRPFWSADSHSLGFFAGGKLKKIDVSGGPSVTLCDATDGRGGAWNKDGLIIFSPSLSSPLLKVTDAGGAPTPATNLQQGETGHVNPSFLPDGRHFLYRALSGPGPGPIYVASLDSAERKFVLNSDSGNVLYTQGYVLFLRETTLMAQPFDAKRLTLTAAAFPIAEQIRATVNNYNPAGVFSGSQSGVLAYQTDSAAAGTQLKWFDRAGKEVGVLGDSVPSAPYWDLKLSVDGKRASVSAPDPSGKGRDIWLYDVARDLRTRFTFDAADEYTSIWSPDGSSIIFNSRRKGHLDLYRKASTGAGTEELLLEDNLEKYPQSWSPDGRSLLYRGSGGPVRNDLFVLPLSGASKPFPFLEGHGQFSVFLGQFSPDGRWVAYESNESGTYEVYVAPFPKPSGKWQVSTGGGTEPRWRSDGTEIFYLSPDNKMMAAEVNGKGSSFQIGSVKPLFRTRDQGTRYEYDVSADGQRFLINTIPEQSVAAPIILVLNWTAGLKK